MAQCKHCGKSGLSWSEMSDGWRLFEGGEMHNCSSAQSAACKQCGEGDLHWEELEEGWRLVDPEGELHCCRRPDPDDVFIKIHIECNGKMCGRCTLINRNQEKGLVYYCQFDLSILKFEDERPPIGEHGEWAGLLRSESCLRAERKCRK
jgi:hypothetical protein